MCIRDRKTTVKKAEPAAKKAAAAEPSAVKPAKSGAKAVNAVPKAKEKSSPAAKKTSPATQPMKNVEVYSRFTDFDIGLFKSGKHYKLYEKLGSHVVEFNGVVGTYFAVWAPNAQYISVIGDFNGWNRGSHALYVRWDGSGIWEGFIPNTGSGYVYKYYVKSSTGEDLEKADPLSLIHI